MASTTIATGSDQALRLQSVALFAAAQNKPGELNTLSGPMPTVASSMSKLRTQTSSGMPIVRAMDLESSAGEKIVVDLVNDIAGKPIMGDAIAQGRGEALTFSSMEVKIDQARKPVDLGGRMARKRTKHDLKKIGLANLAGYMAHLAWQRALVHMAGARGTEDNRNWKIPLSTDADFSSIMVNTVKAPTYNRHYVVNGTALTKGGLQVASIATTDSLTLNHIDLLRQIVDDMAYQLQPVKVPDDPAADDDPLWVLMVTPRVYTQLLQSTTGAGSALRLFQSQANARASYGSKHPLFRGDVGLWNGILVKKMTRSICLDSAGSYSYVAAADTATGNETTGTVATIANYRVDRCLLLGAQAACMAYGTNEETDFPYSIQEEVTDFKNRKELCVNETCGVAKTRFAYKDSNGANEMTDHGVLALDVAVKI